MLGDLLGGLIDKEKATRETIKATLEELMEELGAEHHKEFFVSIQPVSVTLEFKLYLYHIKEGKPTFVREVPLKEVTG